MKYRYPREKVLVFTASSDVGKLGFSVTQWAWPMHVNKVNEDGESWARHVGIQIGDEVLAFNSTEVQAVANGTTPGGMGVLVDMLKHTRPLEIRVYRESHGDYRPPTDHFSKLRESKPKHIVTEEYSRPTR